MTAGSHRPTVEVVIERQLAQSVLTETESRIAALAAAGFTNREIGERLSLSPKTVGSNLSRVYRKLGLRSRLALAAPLGVARPTGERRWAEDGAGR
jgi:DNA-binding CsgD family transcriptional regulator